MTDAPDPPDPQEFDPASIEATIAAWRAELNGQISVSASEVQDHLLDLWGHLPEGDVRTRIERWLTETLERNLYAVADVDRRLASVVPGS